MHITAGIDEVGRGALAGPVVVGAAWVAEDQAAALVAELLLTARLSRLVDSKKMSRAQRERAYAFLENRLAWSVGVAEAGEIDRIGLGKALRLAASRSLDGLKGQGVPLTRVEADAGLFHLYEAELPTRRTVKGDEGILPITLASIMAKVWRDRLMVSLSGEFPGYGWERNAGYGTAEHREALKKGLSPQHRKSFLGPLSA